MIAKKPTKAQARALETVTHAAREKNIQVRFASSIKSPGALCLVKDKLVLFVKRTLDIDDQVAIMRAELERFDKNGMAAVQIEPVIE